jgi:prepilin-type N-terminal cleavage/methylation domain-containing protein
MKKAYSLLELSIVVVIIGLLISGVTAGLGMIRASKISNARLFTSKSPVLETSGLVAWYETSLRESLDINQANNGTAVTNWYDINPGSNSGVAGATKKNKLESTNSSTTFVSDGINGVPSIKFVSGGKFTLSSFYQGASAQNTIFVVVRPSIAQITPRFILDSFSSNVFAISLNASGVALRAPAAINFNTPISEGSDYIISAYFNNADSKVFVNSASTAITTSTTIGSNSLVGLTVGLSQSGTNQYAGLISEIIIFNRILKTQERKDIMKYLSRKYKISVSGL